MSATTIAADIVAKWDELSRDFPENRETYLRNTLIEFQKRTAERTIEFLTEDIKP
jgi:hypothetical protein